MRNTELIREIYKRCPKLENFTEGHRNQCSIDQLFDRCLDVIYLIEKERPNYITQGDKKLQDYTDKQEFFNDTK